MRRVVCLVFMGAVGCSSSSDKDECPIVGTYAVLGAAESGNTCPDDINEQTTYTVSAATGGGYTVAFQGVSGVCSAQDVSACKIQGACEFEVRDPVDPARARGTFQFSWTFSEQGFRGPVTIAIPAAKSIPGGCSGTSTQTGTRR